MKYIARLNANPAAWVLLAIAIAVPGSILYLALTGITY